MAGKEAGGDASRTGKLQELGGGTEEVDFR